MSSLAQPAVLRIELRGTFALKAKLVEAALVLCGVKIFISTPALHRVCLTQFAIVSLVTGLNGLIVVINNLLIFPSRFWFWPGSACNRSQRTKPCCDCKQVNEFPQMVARSSCFEDIPKSEAKDVLSTSYVSNVKNKQGLATLPCQSAKRVTSFLDRSIRDSDSKGCHDAKKFNTSVGSQVTLFLGRAGLCVKDTL